MIEAACSILYTEFTHSVIVHRIVSEHCYWWFSLYSLTTMCSARLLMTKLDWFLPKLFIERLHCFFGNIIFNRRPLIPLASLLKYSFNIYAHSCFGCKTKEAHWCKKYSLANWKFRDCKNVCNSWYKKFVVTRGKQFYWSINIKLTIALGWLNK